jgi:hypothetical protein
MTAVEKSLNADMLRKLEATRKVPGTARQQAAH